MHLYTEGIGAIFTWENGDVFIDNTAREINEEGTYWLERDVFGCILRDTITVEQLVMEPLNLGENTLLPIRGTIKLEADEDYDSYLWSDGSTDSFIDVSTPGIYGLQATLKGCEIKGSIEIYSSIEIPSAFSPNGDGINEMWEISGLEYFPNTEIKIFNRWGNFVFSSSDYQNDWDGGGLPVGTYYFILEQQDLEKSISGVITIVK